DGIKYIDAWTQKASNADVSEDTRNKPTELRVEYVAGGNQLIVTVVPTGQAADRMWAAAVGLSELDKHLEKLDLQIAKGPATATAYAERAMARARCGLFRAADDDYARAIELDPSDHFNWYRRACLLAYLNDTRAHRAICRAMLERFDDAKFKDEPTI